jgi:hypothetical protein
MPSKLQTDLVELHQRHERRVDRIRSLPNVEEETIRYLLAEEEEAYRQALRERIRGTTLRQDFGCFGAFLFPLGVLLLVLAFIFVFAPTNMAGLVSIGFAIAGGLVFVATAIIYLGDKLVERNQFKDPRTEPPGPPDGPRSSERITR